MDFFGTMSASSHLARISNGKSADDLLGMLRQTIAPTEYDSEYIHETIELSHRRNHIPGTQLGLFNKLRSALRCPYQVDGGDDPPEPLVERKMHWKFAMQRVLWLSPKQVR
jgi:hypothetical protein